MIPKIIHYCWFGQNPYPPMVAKCINSWKKFCPDYEFVCWNEKNFDVNMYAYAKEAYALKKWAYVSDVARLYAVNKMGGVYLDTDVELIKPLESLLQYTSFWGFENKTSVATGLGFGAEQNHKLVGELLNDYARRESLFDKDGMLLPCTVINQPIFEKFGVVINGEKQKINGDIFLPTDYLCPINFLTGKMRKTENTISIHHYAASWKSPRKRFVAWSQKYLIRLFGEKIGKKMRRVIEICTEIFD